MSESLAIYRQQSAPYWIAGVGNTLGSALFHRGDCRRAKALHQEARELHRYDAATRKRLAFAAQRRQRLTREQLENQRRGGRDR